MIKTVLFDLDGTLLPMNQDVFVKDYFSRLCKFLLPVGFESEKLVRSIWQSLRKMSLDSSDKTNEQIFWQTFREIYGDGVVDTIPAFEKFYLEEFDKVSAVSSKNPLARKAVDLIKEKGMRIAVATNPFFPRIATEKRIVWAGFSPSEFELVTVYENSDRAKPNPEYYLMVARMLGVSPDECLMVGNDVDEDMIARDVGMDVFLLTDFIINKGNKDISGYQQGGFADLIEYINTL